MPPQCFMSVICGMDYIWQWLITLQITKWSQPTPPTCSALTLILGPKILNCVTCHLCSGPRMMVGLWICYPNVVWVLYEACTKIHMDWSPHRSQHDLQLHSRHAQMSSWFSDPRAWAMYLTSVVVVHGQWHSNVHAMLLFYKCYMRHIPCLTGVGNPVYH